MAWVLVTGEDVSFLKDTLHVLRPAGYEVIAVPDGPTALQLLVDLAHTRDLVVLLRTRMGQMDAALFLTAVASDPDHLRWNHAYLLLSERPNNLPADLNPYLDVLAAVVAPPANASDVDGWADLLDALDLAARQLPSHQPPTANSQPTL